MDFTAEELIHPSIPSVARELDITQEKLLISGASAHLPKSNTTLLIPVGRGVIAPAVTQHPHVLASDVGRDHASTFDAGPGQLRFDPISYIPLKNDSPQ